MCCCPDIHSIDIERLEAECGRLREELWKTTTAAAEELGKYEAVVEAAREHVESNAFLPHRPIREALAALDEEATTALQPEETEDYR